MEMEGTGRGRRHCQCKFSTNTERFPEAHRRWERPCWAVWPLSLGCVTVGGHMTLQFLSPREVASV